MTADDTEIRRHLRLGEDSSREFKQIQFNGNHPASPRRDDLADELIAFANANGGMLFCGVTDDGQIQGMSPEQAKEVEKLLVEASTDSVKPALRIDVRHEELADKRFVLVNVPRGHSLYTRSAHAYIRVGTSKREMTDDERLRLTQRRAQGRYLSPDNQVVADTGFETLSRRLWEPLLSAEAAADPLRGLLNLRLLAHDDADIARATVAGMLVCTEAPQEWLPQALIVATHYRGVDRSSGQLDSQQIAGPLSAQIADAVKFVVRNMQVAARKAPAREDLPQYSPNAVFEAVVNAVVHRDYSMSARQIRLSMFKDRLEIDSPGLLPNGMTMEGMVSSQATRNEVIASVFGLFPVGNIPGSENRKRLMERRGDGVSIIRKETQAAAGRLPEYSISDESNLVLNIPAAKLKLIPSEVTITVHSEGEPLPGINVLALFPDKTWQQAITDENGEVILDLYTTDLPMTVYAAAPGYAAGLKREWVPDTGDLLLAMKTLPPDAGSAIFSKGTGHLPGLRGRLNPIRDASDRTYLYADNIAIDQGRAQPVPFQPGNPIRLTDAFGTELSATIVAIIGNAALLEYQPFKPQGAGQPARDG